MTERRAGYYLVDESLSLRADPRGAEPSPIAGVSVAELEEMFENIRWFSRLTISQRLAYSHAQQRRARALMAAAAVRDGT